MRRREFISLIGGAAATWPLAARAQPAGMLRVGMVGAQLKNAPTYQAFLRRLAELGYQDGKNLDFQFIHASKSEDYAPATAKLVAAGVDILAAIGTEMALKTALATTSTIPIVMLAIDYDPIALGYVKNLARPPGNLTGIFLEQIELTEKRVEVIKDVFPDLRAATVFWDWTSADQFHAAQSAAKTLGIELYGSELREQPYDYDKAFAAAPVEYRGWLFVTTTPSFFRDRAQIADLALRQRVPSVFAFREWVDAGGLMSYGPSVIGMFRRAADYVDRIAQGTKPSDLPIEQPTTFEFVLNLKTAKAIGFPTPTGLLLRADQVIE